MIRLNISLDTAQLAGLDKLRDRSINTAFAKALTFTAQDAQLALKAETASLFVLRRDWVPKGIRIRPANGGNLTAVVGSIDKHMERHVIGAGKEKATDNALSIRSKRDTRGRLASGGILIQPYGSIGSAQVHTVVRRRLKRMDGQSKKPFHIVKGGKVMVVKRRTKKRYPLQALAVVQAGATINENWNMVGTLRSVVAARFEGHFMRAIGNASRS